MASFNFIDAAGHGYTTVWDERAYLMRLAAPPLFIKLVCHSIILLLGWEDQFFRQAVIMLPSFFADGWMLSHLVRLLFLGQRWPFRPTGDQVRDMAALENRAQGIMGGALTFVLIQFLLTGLVALFMNGNAPSASPAAQAELPAGFFFIGLALMVFLVWAFRFVWFYIPAALGYPLKQFARDLGSFATSLYMIGTWLICCIPVLFLFGSLSSVIIGSGLDADHPSLSALFVMTVINICAETLTSLIATAGMASGIREILHNPQQRHRG